MKRVSLFALLLALLAWPLVMRVWARPATAVPHLTITPSPTSNCPTATVTPIATPTPYTATPLPTPTPCNFPPTITPSPTSNCPTVTPTPYMTPTPFPTTTATPTPSATPCNFPPTPTPSITTTPVFSATVHVTTSESNVTVGEVVTVTTDLTIAPGCVYPVYDLTLTQQGDDAPIFAPESVVVGPPVPMPQAITVTAVTTGTINFHVLLYGERNCGGGWQWMYLSGNSSQVTVQNPSSGELPDLIISDITYNPGTPQCGTHPPDLGARVWVQNVGNAAAGSFIVEVNGSQQQTIDGLAAGEETSLVFGGALGSVTAVADATNQVEESDESNNSFTTILPVPTLPPPCPTPSYYNYLPLTVK